MSHQYHRMGMRELKPQVPHPRLTGMTVGKNVLVSEEKTTAWMDRWERDFRGQWVERADGKFYPRTVARAVGQ